jgi:hypothetical protein
LGLIWVKIAKIKIQGPKRKCKGTIGSLIDFFRVILKELKVKESIRN